MNRLTKIVLKNFFPAVPLFAKVFWYAAHRDKYSREHMLQPFLKILDRSKASGDISIEVYGRENIPEGPFIFYPNHQGIFDGFAMIEACKKPFSPVIKHELMKIPFVKQLFLCLYAMPMDRENAKQSLKVIQEVQRRVEAGEACLIFPEGTRSKNGNKLLDFKGGSFRPAIKTKCPVVPVALIDSFKPFDKDDGGHVTVQVHILKPMLHDEYKEMKGQALADEVKSRIEETIEKYA